MNLLNLFKRNWKAILYFNFKMLPFRQAIKFPFDFYGKIRFRELDGKIVINVPVHRGMVEIGHAESVIFPKEETIICIRGKVSFGGKMSIGSGSCIELGKDSIISFGDDVMFLPRTRMLIRRGLTVGNHVRFSWEGQVFDSNFHYMRNIITGEINDINKPVVIGNHVWCGNRVTLNKGTHLPDYTIVASNSLCNKNYSKDEKTHLTLAGQPAKIVAEGYERIFESLENDLCMELQEKFRNT